MREMISLFAVGNPVLSDTLWEDWYQFCLQQEQKYGFVFSHVSCRTESLHPDGIRTRSRYLKKMETAINRKENIFSMEFYLLPKEFYQAVFDFKVYMGLSLGDRNYCEITIEDHFLEEFPCQDYLDKIRKFLQVTRAEINLLPNGQVFNYNVNCILNPVDGREARHIIRKIYAE